MYIITDKCLKCGTCAPGCGMTAGCDGHTCYIQCGAHGCHVGAIIESISQYIITENCTDCGECAKVCPNGAIIPGITAIPAI
ncbi:MAG: 4Fe-4S dicluster domain [Firmicutes bacterium]|nr:4Fe-4S dicluster domain [Bacillota bacterium]